MVKPTVHAASRHYEGINKPQGKFVEWVRVPLCSDGQQGGDTTEIADLVTCEPCRELLVSDVAWFLERMSMSMSK